MRFDLANVKLETFYEALTMLRYTRAGHGDTEWRRGKYHLFIRQKRKRGLALSLHVDCPSAFPPFHRARHKGKDLEAEMQRILDAYAKRRAGK